MLPFFSLHLMLIHLTNPDLLFCHCTVFISPFFSQRHSGGSRNIHLGKTSFVQKGRSMFPKVLLQWCAAISSCAAEIGNLLTQLQHVRLSALSASYLCCAIMAHSCYNSELCHQDSGSCLAWRMLSCWVVQKRWDAASCYATAILRCSCILVKGISLLL